MKNLFIISLLLFVGLNGFGQNPIQVEYCNQFGEHLVLNINKTFSFSYKFDLMGSSSVGVWTISNDTILLEITTINDTTLYKDEEMLSVSHEFPSKLYHKKDRLYLINKNGKLLTKKMNSFNGKKKVVPYYIKIKNK